MAANERRFTVLQGGKGACPDWLALVAWYDGNMEDSGVFWGVASHLPDCPDCLARVRFFRTLRSLPPGMTTAGDELVPRARRGTPKPGHVEGPVALARRGTPSPGT